MKEFLAGFQVDTENKALAGVCAGLGNYFNFIFLSTHLKTNSKTMLIQKRYLLSTIVNQPNRLPIIAKRFTINTTIHR